MTVRGCGYLVLALLTAACASYTPAVGAADAVNPAHAYLYGRFITNDAAGGGMSVGLVFGCSDGSTYTVGVARGQEIQVIEIRPARCSFDKIVFASGSEVLRYAYPPPPANRSIEYLPGRAYYVGDFALTTARGVDIGFMTTEHHWSWDLKPLPGRYATTTEEMTRRFPRFASLPAKDANLTAPPRPGPGVAAPPGEAPLTPERVAVLAPFIKRVYPSPAACAGACELGQCVPFRGETGVAIACVTRCRKDTDCPPGLACNCPHDEKPATTCQPIAATPTDRMAGFCLLPVPPTP